jgi:diaminopimelate decarboxylase
MDHFQYKNGTLHAEDVAIPDISAAVGTPFYVYSTATLTRHYRLFTEALTPLPHMVCFAIKSLSNVAVLKALGDLGPGMDVVSGGEYLRAKAAGVPGDRIVFSGVGKTREEMRLALDRRHPAVQRGIRTRDAGAVRSGHQPWFDGPHRGAGEPGCGRQDP